MGVSVCWPLGVLCVFVCLRVCDIKSDYQQTKHIMCQTSVSLLQKTLIKVLLVLRYQASTCLDPYYRKVKKLIKCDVIMHSAEETGD